MLWTERQRPDAVSVGDETCLELSPALLRLLQADLGEGLSLGAGSAAPWALPVGAAIHAAVGVSSLQGREDLNSWTGVRISAAWARPCEAGQAVRATARITRIGRTSMQYSWRAETLDTRQLLAEGDLVLASRGPAGARVPTLSLGQDEVAPPAAATNPRFGEPAAPLPAVDRGGARAAMARLVARLPRPIQGELRRRYRALEGARRQGGGWPRAIAAAARAARVTAAPRLEVMPPSLALRSGEQAEVSLTVSELGSEAPFDVVVQLPFGHGIDFAWRDAPLLRPARGAQTIRGMVTAQRPDEVNLTRPWPARFELRSRGETVASAELAVSVPDLAPGRIFYVLTEDCETFDGGELTGDYGSLRDLGNANNVMDTEEYRVQMVSKPDTLNRIAESWGARITHFWTATQRFAAAWVAERSRTGAWRAVIEEMDESVRRGSRLHEYAPHVHFDFEPDSALPPQPRLLYDADRDGFLPKEYYHPQDNRDHKYHGWDGARKGIAYVKRLGDLLDIDSKAGSLNKSLRFLASLVDPSHLCLTVRTGAADFGHEPEDLAVSREAVFLNGLLANADAGIYERPGHPRNRQVYFCRPDSLDHEVEDLREASLLQLQAPLVMIDGTSLADLNAWFEQRLTESRGPGVHVIMSMTHAMFMRGEPDPFRSLQGGDFEKLDRHLGYVRTLYPQVRFATASQALVEYLDYYTPVPLAVALPASNRRADGRVWRYPMRILGQGIPISGDRRHRVRVHAPPRWSPADLGVVRVLRHGVEVATRTAPAPGQAITVDFDAEGRDGYELQVECAPVSDGVSGEAAGSHFLEWPHEQKEDIADVEAPWLLSASGSSDGLPRKGDAWTWLFPASLLKLLFNPIEGGTQPIARRTHPLGTISLAAPVHAMTQVLGPGWQPHRVSVRWVATVAHEQGFLLHLEVEESTAHLIKLTGSLRQKSACAAEIAFSLRRDLAGS